MELGSIGSSDKVVDKYSTPSQYGILAAVGFWPHIQTFAAEGRTKAHSVDLVGDFLHGSENGKKTTMIEFYS